MILSLFIYLFFFYKKILRAQKALKRKNHFHPLRSLCAQKIVAFVVYCLLNFVLLVNVYL